MRKIISDIYKIVYYIFRTHYFYKWCVFLFRRNICSFFTQIFSNLSNGEIKGSGIFYTNTLTFAAPSSGCLVVSYTFLTSAGGDLYSVSASISGNAAQTLKLDLGGMAVQNGGYSTSRPHVFVFKIPSAGTYTITITPSANVTVVRGSYVFI